VQSKETLESKRQIEKKKNSIKGKLQEALEMLILYSKECKEDASEIKLVV
jgi:hypothetical protein